VCLAVPGRIEAIVSGPGGSPLEREGRVDFGGVARRISLAFVPEAIPGDFVLVHAGVAIRTLDADSARETRGLLASLPEAESRRMPEGPSLPEGSDLHDGPDDG